MAGITWITDGVAYGLHAGPLPGLRKARLWGQVGADLRVLADFVDVDAADLAQRLLAALAAGVNGDQLAVDQPPEVSESEPF